jgi:Kdo2-lipid IVA lauroyltransferase/acyltransferase
VTATPPAYTPIKRAQRPAVTPTLAQRAEYAGLRLTSTVLRPFGRRTASQVGAFLGGLGWWPFRIRADRVVRAVRACFPELSEREVRAVARGSYRSLGRTAMEMIFLSRAGVDAVLDAFVEPDGWEILEQAVAGGSGVILISAHIGNWELSAAYIAARGVPLDVIGMHMANPLTDDFLLRTRERLGSRQVFDDEAVRATPRALKEGRAVGFMSDQGAKGLAATYVDFFGRPARTPRGAAVFGMRSRLPMIFVAAIRQPDLRYRLHVAQVPLADSGDKERDVEETVKNYTKVIEDFVRRFPEQYFWQHRRWKRQPPDTPPHLREP